MQRRLVVFVFAAIILGLATTWSVGWGCALWAPVLGQETLRGEAAAQFLTERFGEPGDARGSSVIVTEGFGWSSVHGPRPKRPGVLSSTQLLEVRAGWPYEAVGTTLARGERSGDSPVRRAWLPTDSFDVLAVRDRRPVPYGPLWRGMVADSAIFAVAWFVVLAGPFVLRGAWRRSRGRCPSCGYDLRGHAELKNHGRDARATGAGAAFGGGCPE